jgi:hypothetical protein
MIMFQSSRPLRTLERARITRISRINADGAFVSSAERSFHAHKQSSPSALIREIRVIRVIRASNVLSDQIRVIRAPNVLSGLNGGRL